MPIARCQMTPKEVANIQPHPSWDDGREGFIWCRFDALLTEAPPFYRSEITLDDDSEFEDNTTGEIRVYFNPILLLETNVKIGDELKTVDQIQIDIERKELYTLLMGDPKDILHQYAEQLAKLKKE